METNGNDNEKVDDKNDNEDGKKDGGKTSAEEMYELTVNGEKREVTMAEMQELATKSAGADAKFQEASRMRKDAEDGVHFKQLIQKTADPGYEPTEADIRELSALTGVDPDEFMSFLTKGGSVDKDKDDGKGEDGVPGIDFSKEFESTMGMTVEEAKNAISSSFKRDVNDARQQIRGESDNAVDKDEFFGKMKIGEQGRDRAEVIKEMVAEDVFGRIRNGEPYGADLIAKSVQKVRSMVKRFGMPAKPDQQLLTLGPGPSEGISAEVQSETPIKRVSASEQGAEDNFVSRYLQKMLQKRRNAGA